MENTEKELILDFDSSFLTFIVKNYANYGRFQIDSKCTIQSANGQEKYYVLHPVMACNVFEGSQLIKNPAYRFQAVFSKKHFKIFRAYPETGRQNNTFGTLESEFEGIEMGIHEREMTLLDSSKDIVNFAKTQGRICGKISFDDMQGSDSRSITIDFPVRHINTNPVKELFQVEAGTVALPDYTLGGKSEINSIFLYYIAFNQLTCMDVISMPVSIIRQRECIIRLYGCN